MNVRARKKALEPMSKSLIKRYFPNHDKVRHHRHLRLFGDLLHDPNLWHINRRSTAGAFAVGGFMAFVPVPFQMVLAAAAAIPLRVNLPISVALVWITNPITIPPMFFMAYLLGAWVLGEDAQSDKFDYIIERLLDMDLGGLVSWLWEGGLNGVWTPLLLGSLICSIITAVLGYCLIRGLWRLNAVRRWERRKDLRNRQRDLMSS